MAPWRAGHDAGCGAGAATFGLPERAEADRNYDYRYVWLRDGYYAGLAVGVTEPHPLLHDAVAFTAARVVDVGDRLAPAYRTDGSSPPDQSTLRLSGYPGGAAVVGNRATGQFQLDALGELLQLLATMARHDYLDVDARNAVDVVTDLIATRWQVPDAGVWDLQDVVDAFQAGLCGRSAGHRRATCPPGAVPTRPDGATPSSPKPPVAARVRRGMATQSRSVHNGRGVGQVGQFLAAGDSVGG